MFGLTDRHFFLLAVVVYGVSTVYSILLWRKGFRQDNRVNYLLLVLGLGLHTIAMAKRGFTLARCPVNNLYEATTFVAWTIGAMYLGLGLLRPLRFLGVFAAPVLFGVGVFALMPDLDKPGPQPMFRHALSSLHASLSLLAYGAFGLGCVAALMYLSQSHDLKFRKLRAVFALLPPIQRLEMVTGRMLLGGFVLLTAGLTLGCLWLKQEKGVYVNADPKVIWSAFVWLLYLGLLAMRWLFAQRGRRFAWGVIGSFSFVMLTFWVFSLWSAIHNPTLHNP